MTDENVLELNDPGQNDPLQEMLRGGARKMLTAAIELEVASFIDQHYGSKTAGGKVAVVRNRYLPERFIQTRLIDIAVKVPKVRDRSGSGIKFNCSLIPLLETHTTYRRIFTLATSKRCLYKGHQRDPETPVGTRCIRIVAYDDLSFEAAIGTELLELERA